MLLSDIRTIVVGSLNPVKVAATRAVLEPLTPRAHFSALSVPSQVPDQPMGDDETIRGARNRAEAALKATGADLAVGIEGGCVDGPDGMRSCAWAVVVDRTGRVGTGGSLAMPLPPSVAAMIRDGMELGHAMDALVAQHNTKHGAGAVGILTDGLVDRQRAYEILLTYALAPFLTPDFWA